MPPKPRPSPVIATRITRAHLYAACADASSLLRAVGTDGRELLGAYLATKSPRRGGQVEGRELRDSV